jgi:hypothetical protein
MLKEFKTFLESLELNEDHDPDVICCVLTQRALDSLTQFIRAVWGETAASVIEEQFTQREDGSMVVSGDLVGAFSDSIKGVT